MKPMDLMMRARFNVSVLPGMICGAFMLAATQVIGNIVWLLLMAISFAAAAFQIAWVASGDARRATIMTVLGVLGGVNAAAHGLWVAAFTVAALLCVGVVLTLFAPWPSTAPPDKNE